MSQENQRSKQPQVLQLSPFQRVLREIFREQTVTQIAKTSIIINQYGNYNPNFNSTGYLDTIKQVCLKNGWQHLTTGLAMEFTQRAFQGVYSSYIEPQLKNTVQRELAFSHKRNIVKLVVSGFTLGFISISTILIVYSSGIVHRLTALDLGQPKLYKNSIDCLRQIIQNQGIRGLFSCFMIDFTIGSIQGSFLQISSQAGNKLVDVVKHKANKLKNKTVRSVINFYCSCNIHGILLYMLLAKPIITVLDKTIYSRFGVQGFPKYSSLFNCLTQTIKQEGFLSLYRGIRANLFVAVAGSVISVAVQHLILYLKKREQKQQELEEKNQ